MLLLVLPPQVQLPLKWFRKNYQSPVYVFHSRPIWNVAWEVRSLVVILFSWENVLNSAEEPYWVFLSQFPKRETQNSIKSTRNHGYFIVVSSILSVFSNTEGWKSINILVNSISFGNRRSLIQLMEKFSPAYPPGQVLEEICTQVLSIVSSLVGISDKMYCYRPRF